MQLELGLYLAAHGDHAGVVGAGADLAEPDVVAFDEQLDAEDAQSGGLTVKANAEVVCDGFGNLAAALQGCGAHGVRLPAFNIVAADLDVADRVAKMGFYIATCTQGAHGELGDFVVEVNEAFNNYAASLHTATGHGVVPGGFDVCRAGDFALAFAG